MAEFKHPTQAEFEAKTSKIASGLLAESAIYDPATDAIAIRLTNGVAVAFPLKTLGLERAAPADLQDLVIEGGGYGLHVPAIDADISIPQLFQDHLGAYGLMKRWSRAVASRRNGRLGGRPKTSAA